MRLGNPRKRVEQICQQLTVYRVTIRNHTLEHELFKKIKNWSKSIHISINIQAQRQDDKMKLLSNTLQ